MRLLESAGALKRLPRTGWLLAGVAQPESVAEHSYATALLAMALAAEINRAPEDHDLPTPLDIGRVVQIALVHDLAEATLTDLPKRATDVLGQAVKHEAEERGLRAALGDHPEGDLYLALWQEYAEGATPESRAVRDADKLEMVYQASVYETAGHRRLSEFWEGHRWQFSISEEIFECLRRARRT